MVVPVGLWWVSGTVLLVRRDDLARDGGRNHPARIGTFSLVLGLSSGTPLRMSASPSGPLC